jgi:hypothetical protein
MAWVQGPKRHEQVRLKGRIRHLGKDQWTVDGFSFTCSLVRESFICRDLKRAMASEKPAQVWIREDGVLLGVNINDPRG